MTPIDLFFEVLDAMAKGLEGLACALMLFMAAGGAWALLKSLRIIR